jgi:hypothetical protein
MLTAETHIQTERPSRYLVQLCKHADSINDKILHFHASTAQSRPEVQHAEWSGTDGTLTFSGGRCTLHAGPDTLTVRVDATSEEELQRIQGLITRNLERFGRRDQLKVNWQQPEAPTIQADAAG